MSRGKNRGLEIKMGGLKVKGMIEAVEQKMAEGETVSAAPSSEAEVKAPRDAREQNRNSGGRADLT